VCGLKGASASAQAPVRRRDRRVYRIEEMTSEQIAAIEKAEVPAEYAYLDEELKDWKP
jgi:hypothetical protein